MNLLDCKFKRTAPITLSNNSEVKQDYKFMGWANNKNTWTVDFNNKATIKNFRGVTENNKVYNLYALWEREIKLAFNMNGGKYKGNSDDVILNAKIYNSKYNYTFNIAGGLTGKVTNTQTAQNIAIDAYGEYDSDGINTLYTRRDSNGLLYRFIGWALSSDATEPISNMSPYDTNPESTYEIYSNTTLYAVWEPVLTMNVSLNRALGDLTFNNGTAPATSLQAITASTPNPLLTVIIKPGEEGRYSVETYNTGLTFKTAFDTRITDVYTHEGTWTDNLNPSTSEDLVAGQGHGLDRAFNIDSAYSVRSFRIPQYLGTDKSYSSSIGVNKYGVLFDISKHSYFYNKIHGTDEEIRVTGLIFITPEQSNTTDDVDSVLDALRTKLKIRLK